MRRVVNDTPSFRGTVTGVSKSKTLPRQQESLPEADIYVRISSANDTDGVERLVKDCQATAAHVGWHVPPERVFIDNDISASRYTKKRRPAYDAVLDRISTGVTKRLITWHTDRMHRRPVELESFIDLVEEHGVEIMASKVGKIDLTTPSGRAMARVLGALAAFESEHKSDRIRSRHAEIAGEGGWHGGIRPFGYRGGRAKDGNVHEIVESEAAEIRRIADAVIRGQSLRSLAIELNERGVKTVTGKTWSSAHLRSVLTRNRLAGLREHRGKIVAEAAWPAILDRPTFDALKTILEDPARNTGGGGRRGRVPTSLGTGIYVCGVCGEPRLRLGSNNRRRSVYKCGNVAMSNEAGHVARTADSLDAYVEGVLLEKLSEPGVIEAMCGVIDSDDEELAAMSREQATIRPRLKKATSLWTAGSIDDLQFEQISKELRDRNAEITTALTAASKRSPLDVLLGAENIEQMWDEELTLGVKRAILAETLVVTVLPSRSGRQPGGGYFNTDHVKVELTDRARQATR